MKEILVICEDKEHAKRLYDLFLRVFSQCATKVYRNQLEVVIVLGVGIYRDRPVLYKFVSENNLEICLKSRHNAETMYGHKMEKDLDDWLAMVKETTELGRKIVGKESKNASD